MNNIEIQQLKRDVMEHFDNPELAEGLVKMNEQQLQKLKKQINEIKNKKIKTNLDQRRMKQAMGKIETYNTLYNKGQGLVPVKTITTSGTTSQSATSESTKPKKAIDSGIIKAANLKTSPRKAKVVPIPANRKPKILLIADVKNWAWWLKGEFLVKYLSDEFDVELVCVLGPGCMNQYQIPQQRYDLYFTFGYSYIDFLYNVPKHKKATGVTAHRPPNMIIPKMKQAGHLHANSMMLHEELLKLGFPKVHYIPNGVDERLFRIVKPIPPTRDKIICGHVGKECPAKGQKEILYPAIQKAGGKKVTSVVTWKEKIPHKQMYKIYQEMDVFLVASVEDGTPNGALEAAACGRPILSNKIGNMPELIKDGVNGFIVNRQIGDYVEKIKWLQANRDKMIKMGLKAREEIEKHWTWKIQAENYRKMFREIFVREK